MTPVADLPRETVGTWLPIAASEAHDICDTLIIEGVTVGHIESSGADVYGYIFGKRIGAYGTVTGARLEVEECAVRAMPLIRWLAIKEYLL